MDPKRQKQCIYCRCALDSLTKRAHVFPKSLGGRIYSRLICCSGCNEEIGLLEEDLQDKLRPCSGAIGALTGGNRQILAVINDEGHTYELSGARAMRKLATPSRIASGKELRIPLPAKLEEQAKCLAYHMWKCRRTPSDLRLEENENPEFEWRTMPIDLNFDLDRHDFRVFTKIGLELLEHLRPGAAREYRLTSSRRFVSHDEGTISFKPDAISVGSGLASDRELAEFAHVVEVWTHGKNLNVRIVLFRDLIMSAPICTDWPREPLSLLYSVDPQQPSNSLLKDEDKDGEPLALVTPETMRDSMGRFAERFEAASKKLNDELPPLEAADDPTLEELLPLVKAEYKRLVERKGSRTRD